MAAVTLYNIPTDQSRDIDADGKRSSLAVHKARLFYMERARLCAACDGDSEMYARLTAYQSVFYIAASLSGLAFTRQNGFELSKDDAFSWARRLRNEALIAYMKVGRRYYYEIKEKSGIDEKLNPKFGRCKVSPIPAIQEVIIQKYGSKSEKVGMVGRSSEQDQNIPPILRLNMSFLALDKNIVEGNPQELGKPIYLFGSTSCYLFFARGLYHLCSDYVNEFDHEKEVNTLEEWDEKISYAYHLFSYAWAIAADGGRLSSNQDEIVIARDFSRDSEFDEDVASVRDLYPYRVADIAPLGRIFAAFCSVLRLYSDSPERERCESVSQWLLSDLSQQNESQFDSRIFGNQTSFNEHLHTFIEHSRNVIATMKENAQLYADINSLKKTRNRKLKELMDSLLQNTTHPRE